MYKVENINIGPQFFSGPLLINVADLQHCLKSATVIHCTPVIWPTNDDFHCSISHTPIHIYT